THTDGIQSASPIALNGGTIKDRPGINAPLSFTAPNTTAVFVDTTAPTLDSVTAPADGRYRAGQNLDFTVNYNENVTVTGTPTIGLTIGATARNASYVSGSGAKVLIFRYTIVSGDNDSDGIAMASTITLGGG